MNLYSARIFWFWFPNEERWYPTNVWKEIHQLINDGYKYK